MNTSGSKPRAAVAANPKAASPGAACKIRQLTWDKIDKTEDGVVITMVLEKTIQYRQRLHRIPLKAEPDNEFCPVRCLQDLVDMVLDPSGYALLGRLGCGGLEDVVRNVPCTM